MKTLTFLGTIEYVSLTADKLEQALSVMKESFFIYENVSIAVELDKSPEGRKELEELSLNAARDGVSIIAVEKATGNVIGVSFNKLQVKLPMLPIKYFILIITLFIS